MSPTDVEPRVMELPNQMWGEGEKNLLEGHETQWKNPSDWPPQRRGREAPYREPGKKNPYVLTQGGQNNYSLQAMQRATARDFNSR